VENPPVAVISISNRVTVFLEMMLQADSHFNK